MLTERFRKVTEGVVVSDQIAVADVAAAAALGVRLIINNRPEHESPDQTAGAAIASAAGDSGVAYVAMPIRGAPSADQALAFAEAVRQADGPVLAYCRSGTRSIMAWGLGEVLSGARTPAEVVALAAACGYDLSAIFNG